LRSSISQSVDGNIVIQPNKGSGYWVRNYRNEDYLNVATRFKYSTYPLVETGFIDVNNQYAGIKSDKTSVGKICYRFRFRHELKSGTQFGMINGFPTQSFNPNGTTQTSMWDGYISDNSWNLYEVYRDSKYVHNQAYKEFPYLGIHSGSTVRTISGEYRIGTSEGKSCKTRHDCLVIPFLGDSDYNLFSTGQVAMVRNAITVRLHYGEAHRTHILPDGSGEDYAGMVENSRFCTRKESNDKQLLMINVNASNLDDISVSQYLSTNESEQTFENTTHGDSGIITPFGGEGWAYYNSVVLTQTVLLNRSLRVAEFINHADYIQYESSKRTTLPKSEGDKLIIDSIEKQIELDDKREFVYV
jgi:hypothetical protein